MATKIFLSYSHQDEAVWEEFLVYLMPYARDLTLDVWSDARIQASKDWNKEIHDAIASAEIGVGLVSQHFVASKYVMETEMKLLLEAAEAGKKVCTWLFLAPSCASTDKDFGVDCVLSGGTPNRVPFSKYQGLNSLTDYLANHPKGSTERGVLLERAARELNQLAQNLRHTPVRARSALDGRPELAIHLKFANGRIVRTYFTGDQKLLIEIPGPIPLCCEEWQRRGLAIVKDAKFRSELFEVLFGSNLEEVKRVLGALAPRQRHMDQISPLTLPCRTEIVSGEPSLLSLPWAVTSWNGHRLVNSDWTFELRPPEPMGQKQHRTQITLRTPCSLLLLLPRKESSAHTQAQMLAKALREKVLSSWPNHRKALAVSQDLEETRQLLKSHRPEIVIHLGEGGRLAHSQEVDHPDGDSETTAAGSLAALLANHRPDLLVLAFCGPGAKGTTPRLEALANAAHGLVTQWCDSDPLLDELRTRTIRWIDSILFESTDAGPIHLWLQSGFQTAAACSRGASFKIAHGEPNRIENAARHVLDRKQIKKDVSAAVDELLAKEGRRTVAHLVQGTPGNLVAELAEQLHTHFRTYRHEILFPMPTTLTVPVRPSSESWDFDSALRQHFGSDPRQELSEFLKEKLGLPSQKIPIRVLVWSAPGILPSSLEPCLAAFAAFAKRTSTACPNNLRIYHILAVEAEDSDVKALQAAAKALRRAKEHAPTAAFKFEITEPLHHVEVDDLIDFVTNDTVCRCPAALQAIMPERLHDRAQGHFEETVRLIEWAECHSWTELEELLRNGRDVSLGMESAGETS